MQWLTGLRNRLLSAAPFLTTNASSGCANWTGKSWKAISFRLFAFSAARARDQLRYDSKQLPMSLPYNELSTNA
jgi:hypothetical protein